MSDHNKTIPSSPEEALPSSVLALLRVIEYSHIVFHRTYGIYIELSQSRNAGPEILHSALALKTAVDQFDKALHALQRPQGFLIFWSQYWNHQKKKV